MIHIHQNDIQHNKQHSAEWLSAQQHPFWIQSTNCCSNERFNSTKSHSANVMAGKAFLSSFWTKKTYFYVFRHAENGSPKFLSSEKNPKITPHGHSNGRRSLHHHKITNKEGTPAGCSTPSSMEEPPHSKPSYSGPKPPHCSFPPVALQATDHHQLQTEYSLIRLFVLEL